MIEGIDVLRKISFEEILPFWENKLWPNRKTRIDPVSVIRFMGGHDLNIKKFAPTFWGYFIDNKIIGVNSGCKSSLIHYRSRGIYVEPEYRRTNIASQLMNAVEAQGKREECRILWSMPRNTAIDFYKNFGFIQCSNWFDEDVEFGPNCFVIKNLVSIDHLANEIKTLNVQRTLFFNDKIKPLIDKKMSSKIIRERVWELAEIENINDINIRSL